MKHGTVYELKTLFDPLSAEWEKTNYAQKKEMLEKVFENEKDNAKHLNVKSFLVGNKTPKDGIGGLDYSSADYTNDSLIDRFSLLLAIGCYLNKSVDKQFIFPETNESASLILSDLENLKDGRSKSANKINDILTITIPSSTRELFDHYSGSASSVNLSVKKNKLRHLQEAGVSPLEVLFVHVYNYQSMMNQNGVVEEAPYSAFALCWNENKLV